jgi:hypothetical protein
LLPGVVVTIVIRIIFCPLGQRAEARIFPTIIQPISIGVSDRHPLNLQADALHRTGVSRPLIAHVRRPGSGTAFKEIMCGIVGPVDRPGISIEAVVLQHAAGSGRRHQGDAQVATPLMVGLHSQTHVLA